MTVTAGSLLLLKWGWDSCASAYNEEYEEGQRMPGSMDSFGFMFGVIPLIVLTLIVFAAFTWALYGRVRLFSDAALAIIVGLVRAVALAFILTALVCGASFMFVEAELGGQIFDPVSYREPYVP